ncbi:MAG: hypothetical protein NT144_13290 [Bacteroidia bacterium]|nr:hypothetical protein [Bacteroidia bacterium]
MFSLVVMMRSEKRNRVPLLRDELIEGNLTTHRKIKELIYMNSDTH